MIPSFFADEDFDVYSLSFGLIRKLPNDLKIRFNLSRFERPPEESACLQKDRTWLHLPSSVATQLLMKRFLTTWRLG